MRALLTGREFDSVNIDPRRRRHHRCTRDVDVTYAIINKRQQSGAVARNYSRSGMYFETNASLSPGTLIVVRSKGYEFSDAIEAEDDSDITEDADAAACQELKNQVVGEVKRCVKIEANFETRYGIAVCYVSPAV